MAAERWCVVTGGRGFAARHLVEMLIRYDMFSVRIADLAPTIDLHPNEDKGFLGQALRSARAVYVSMDLRNKANVVKGMVNHFTCLIKCLAQTFFFFEKQHLKELRLSSTWLRRILRLTITSYIIRLMWKVLSAGCDGFLFFDVV